MRRYVQLATSFWIDTQDWPRNARYLFLYLWSNDHVDGITGVGHVPDRLVRAETGLTPKALEKAWEFLVEQKKVVRDNGWYWVIDRAEHTCLRENGKAHARMAPAARSRIGDPSVPDAIRKAFTNTYRILFDNLSNTDPSVPPPRIPIDNLSITSARGHARAVSRKPLAVSRKPLAVDETAKKEKALAESQGKPSGSAPSTPPVPDALKGLQLYEKDATLCRRWPELFPLWCDAYPGLDVLAEVKVAHAWEVSNPKRQKKDKPRFLANWLKREQDRPRRPTAESAAERIGRLVRETPDD